MALKNLLADQIKVTIDQAREKLPLTQKDSFTWIIVEALKVNDKILLPENTKLLNEYMRSLKCVTTDGDEDITVANDFLLAYKDVPAAHLPNFLAFLLAQTEMEESNILSSTVLDVDSLKLEEEDENLTEEEQEKLEEARQIQIDTINDMRAANKDKFQEFFKLHFCKILLLIQNGQLGYTEAQISNNLINEATPETLLHVWKQAEFSQTMDALSVRWRTIVLQKFLDNLKSSASEGVRNELLTTPLTNGDLFIHAAGRLSDDHSSYDIRLMNREPNPGEFPSTTCIVYELRDKNLSEEELAALGKNPIPQYYAIKKVVESDAQGDVKNLNLAMNRLMALKDHLKIYEAPLNRVTPDQCASIREILTLPQLLEIEMTLTGNSPNKGHTLFDSLMDETLAYTNFENKNFWNLNRAHESAVVIAAKNKALRAIRPFIVARNYIEHLHQDAIAKSQKNLQDLEAAKPRVPNNFMEMRAEERNALQQRIQEVQQQIDATRLTIQRLTQAKTDDNNLIRQQLGIAALELSKNAKTQNDWDMVLKLLKNGAKQSFFEGVWPYGIAHYAIMDNRVDVFNQLLQNRNVQPNEIITVNIVNPNAIRPVTPLICAAENNTVSDQTFQALVNDHNIEINFKAGGETALYCAAKAGSVSKVLSLLAVPGLDAESKDNNGVTATAVAEKNGHQLVVNLLKLNQFLEQIYAGDMPRHADTGFMRDITQEQGNGILASLMNRKLANDNLDQDKFSRTSFIMSECIAHYKPFKPNALLQAPQPIALHEDFVAGNKRDEKKFEQTTTTLNSMFTLIRHSSEKNKYKWLGELRQKALDKLLLDVAALQDDHSKRNLLIEARSAGVFSRHRSTCCLFRMGRTDTQVDLDKRIREINRRLGLRDSDHTIVNAPAVVANP